jgi:hypothetical protein
MSAEAIGWTSVAGNRTVVSSEVQDSTAFMNSKNCVEDLHDLRSDEPGPADDSDLHDLSTFLAYV